MNVMGEIPNKESEVLKMETEIKEDLRTALEQFPTKIRVKEELVLEKSINIDELQLVSETIAHSFKTDIWNDEQFKNENSRKAELSAKLKQDPKYLDSVTKLKSLKKELEIEKINLSYLKRRFKAITYLIRLEDV